MKWLWYHKDNDIVTIFDIDEMTDESDMMDAQKM